MCSHFRLGSRAVVACAASGAAAMLGGALTAQAQIAADYATNPIYSGGWAAGQNGGHGFGAWSFDYTSANAGQTMSSSSALGTAWTLYNNFSDVGRGINGGLTTGETFETFIQNPTAYHFYGGFDILFYNGTDNLGAGTNTAALRVSEFNYFSTAWNINDANGGTTTSLNAATTGAAGMKLDLSITSPTTYQITLTPLSNPSAAYTQSGTYAGGPIDYVNYRLWNTSSTGPNDTVDNFEISSMTVVPEPSSLTFLSLGAAGLCFLRRRKAD